MTFARLFAPRVPVGDSPGVRWNASVLVGTLCACVSVAVLTVTSASARTAVSDVPYCSGGGSQLTLDMYIPDDTAPRPLPVAMYIHGGGWSTGSKEYGDWMQPVLDTLVNRGYLAVSINYRLAPSATFPAFLEDAKCAVRFLRANAATYQIDPARIGLWGHSAGGYIASMTGLTGPGAGFEGGGGYGPVSSRVQAVVDISGPADLTAASEFQFPNDILVAFGEFPDPSSALLQRASPVNYGSPDSPPFLIIHGDSDITVSPDQSARLYDRIATAGARAQWISVLNADHWLQPVDSGPTVPSADQIVSSIVAFFDRSLRGDTGSSPPVAGFNAACAGLTCTLEATASSGANPIVSYAWNLNKSPDGTAEGAVVTVTYPHEGPRSVTLTVTDAAGLSASIRKSIEVGPPAGSSPPVAAFTAACIGLTCTLDATASSGANPIVSYSWDLNKFPDGTAEGAVVTVTYPHESPRSVTLTVTDSAGLSASVTQLVSVGP